MRQQSIFGCRPDTAEGLVEYGNALMDGVNNVEQSILDQTKQLGAEFQQIMLLDCATMAKFKELRQSAIHAQLWERLLNLIDFDTFYDPSAILGFKSERPLPFTVENVNEFLLEFGTVCDKFKDRLSKDITAWVDAGKWEMDVLANGNVIGMRFKYEAVIKRGDHYVLNEELKPLMIRLDFLSHAEAGTRFSAQKAKLNLSSERVLPELHFNIGNNGHLIQLLAYPTYFTLLAPNHMEALIASEESEGI